MSDAPAHLVINFIPNPDKMEQVPNYSSQIMPTMIKAGGELDGRYRVIEQLTGEGGPSYIAVFKFANAQAIKDALDSDEYKALENLRREVFSQVNSMICAAVPFVE